MGKEGGPGQGAEAVDGVDAIEQGNAQRGAQGRRLVALDHGRPPREGVGRGWWAVAPGEQGAQPLRFHLGRRDPVAAPHDHLAELVRQAHAPQQIGDPILDGPARITVGEVVWLGC